MEEIYGIRTSGKYGTLKQIYHEFYRIYNLDETKGEIEPEAVVTEDSNSGYQFFDAVCRENGLTCETLNGKSNIFRYLKVHKNEKTVSYTHLYFQDEKIDREKLEGDHMYFIDL